MNHFKWLVTNGEGNRVYEEKVTMEREKKSKDNRMRERLIEGK